MRITAHLLMGCGLAAMAFSLPAAAQESQAAPATKKTTDDVSVGEIVVTARSRSERLQDVPVAGIVVDQQQLRQYDLTSPANIRMVAPQLSLDRGFTGSGSSIALRGVSSSSIDGGVEQSVLLDFDGMAISRGRILNDALFDVDSLTVLKGPQAVFFGKNSPGGVISLRSQNPGSTFNGYVRAGYEFTSDNAQFEAAVGGPLGGGFGARIALFSSDSKGYIRNQNRTGVPDLVRTAASGSTFVPAAQSRLGAERKLAARGTLTYDDGGPFTANFKLLVSSYEGQGLPSFSEIMACPTGRTRPGAIGTVLDPTGDCKLNDRSSQGYLSPEIIAAWPEVNKNHGGRPYSKNNTVLPILRLAYKAGAIDLTSVTGYYDYDYVSQGNADGTSYSYFWSYSNERNKSFYQELRATSSFDGPINFATGGHYERNRRTLFVGAASGPLPRDPATGRYNSNDNQQNNKSEAWSIFGQVTYRPIDQIELAGGARYTRQTNDINSYNTYVHPNATGRLPVGTSIVASKSQNNLSPEATITWRPSRELTVYGAYKTGFLAGAFSNPGNLSSTANASNLSFDAEKVDGFELGVKSSSADGRFTGNLTLYRYKYKGLPLTSLIAIDASTLTYVTQNAADTVAKGVELESTYRLFDGFTLRGSAAYNDSRYNSFQNAQCYTGQTAAQGCIVDPVTRASSQDLSGARVYRAPEWIATGGFIYDADLTDDVAASLNADLRYSSSYISGVNNNPLSRQAGYVQLNAGARVTAKEHGVSLALIGRNLTNRRYATISFDKPGGIGEVYTVAGEPRSVVLQLEATF